MADTGPVVVQPSPSALPPGWNRSANIMEIFVRSYQDSNGDGIGDLKGLTARLDYLKSLGITGLWLMPVGPSQDHDHGYAQVDYRSIDPDYGTLADFDDLVREAHQRGIGIILDFVINHSAATNPLFKSASSSPDSPYRDWYLFRSEDPKWSTFGYDPWRRNPNGEGYYYAIFDPIMPDWNLKNTKVMGYIADSMRFWLNRGVDGFRLDAVTMLMEDGPGAVYNNPKNPGVVAQLNAVMRAYDNRFMICEADKGAERYIQSCGEAFAFGVQQEIVRSAISGKTSAKLIAQLKNPDRAFMPLVLQTHDSYVGDRLIDQFGANGTNAYAAAAAVAILGSDVSFTYYGEEIGESNNGTANDPGLRAPMSWTKDARTAGFTNAKPYRDVAINVAANNAEAEQADPSSLFHIYQSLYRVRNSYPVVASGTLDVVSQPAEPVLVFKRSNSAAQAFVAINLSAAPASASIATGRAATAFVDVLTMPGVEAASPVSDAQGGVSLIIPAGRAVVLMPRP